MRQRMNRFVREIFTLAWTLGGTGMVLITLSGDTRMYGVCIGVGSFALHMLGIIINWKEDD